MLFSLNIASFISMSYEEVAFLRMRSVFSFSGASPCRGWVSERCNLDSDRHIHTGSRSDCIDMMTCFLIAYLCCLYHARFSASARGPVFPPHRREPTGPSGDPEVPRSGSSGPGAKEHLPADGRKGG